MFAIPAMILGAILGWRAAGKRGGVMLDKLQYGFVYAIVFGLIALLLTVFADWQGWV